MAAYHANQWVLYAALAGNLLLAVSGGAYALLRRPLPAWYWTAAGLTAIVTAVPVVLGAVLLLSGTTPRRSLHLLYGALVAAAVAVVAGLRPGGFVRRRYGENLGGGEARIAALVSLTAFALLLRAWMTGRGL
jgi:hypothetical protein